MTGRRKSLESQAEERRESHAESLADSQPKSLDVIKTMLQKGQIRKAARALKVHLASAGSGSNPEVLTLYGRVAMQMGNLDEAASTFKNLLTLQPGNPVGMSALGAIRYSQGAFEESEGLFRDALDRRPDDVDNLGNLGLVTQHLGKHEDALRFLSEALQKGNKNVKVAEALGAEFIHQIMPDRAVQVLRQVVNSQPDNTRARALLGSALGDLGYPAEAEAQWKNVEKSESGTVHVMVARARALRLSGKLEESIALMEKTLDKDPGEPSTLFFWAYVADKNDVSTLSRSAVIHRAETALENPLISHEDRVRIEFALGKLYENDKQHSTAIQHYHRANGLVWLRQPMEKDDYDRAFNTLKSAFNRDFLDRASGILNRQPVGDDRCGDGLIFIVGMPRSGTTLVEQIVTRRPGTRAGGERPDMDALCGQFLKQTTDQRRTCSLDQVREMAAAHHRRVQRIAGGGRFTDKSPRNFMNLGLMATLFPRATFVHCVRNSVDICLSCYSNHFGFNAMKHSYDLEMLGHFYNHYAHMMDHWKSVLPITVYDAVYEDLVANPAISIRSLTDHCGLQWDEAYLNPEQGRQAVKTASLAQVKKPIYTDSVGRWEPYRGHIQPLLAALGQP